MIRVIKYSDISKEFVEQACKERISFIKGDNAHYWGFYEGERLIGCTCLVIFKNGHGKIKSNYVMKEFRKLGVFNDLNKACLKYAKEQGVTNITLNCLADSAEIHKKFGAVVYRETKTIQYMVYRI